MYYTSFLYRNTLEFAFFCVVDCERASGWYTTTRFTPFWAYKGLLAGGAGKSPSVAKLSL